jgi:cellulose synthase/poly-beta-1,6-N-acetylglucosamine synthase-like glycosyltransferase
MTGSDLEYALDLLSEMSSDGLVVAFWYVILLELPRYGLSTASLIIVGAQSRPPQPAVIPPNRYRVSIIAAGHNEAASIDACLRSLRSQSFNTFEMIIVSDGSSDGMSTVSSKLVREGAADTAVATDIRCGKSAAFSLACRMASGDILVNVDCDCSFDRFAIEQLLQPFSDPRVGAVCGDIRPRNGDVSLIAAFQVIEYMLSISLGKRVSDLFEQVVCASGAFAAFRREALQSVGGIDSGGGEDLDLTIRLRTRGWLIRFADKAICYTDVPASAYALLRQRLRWERDALRIRYRKHRRLLRPSYSARMGSETLHQIDFLFFNVALAIIFPLYLVFVAVEYGSNGILFLTAVQLGLLIADLLLFIVAIAVTGRWSEFKFIVFVPGYNLFSWPMRLLRAFAYVQEWMLDSSRRDSYVPHRVSRSRHW